MSYGQGKGYALIYKDEIVSAIQIKNRGNDEIEISRFCNAKFTQCIGAISKLISFIKQNYSQGKLITYIDNRYGDGEYLEKMEFAFISKYPSFKWTNGRITLHRQQYNNEEAAKDSFYKIWDCGQSRYELILKP